MSSGIIKLSVPRFHLTRKNQVTTTAEKKDDTDSTATVTTAAFTSVCESEWDDDITERLARTTTLNNQIYVFGKNKSLTR